MGPFLIILGLYLLYNFIVYFIIPVYKTSRRVQEQFRNMQQQHPNVTPDNKDPRSKSPKASSKDYIDFEEIKD